MIKLIGIKRIIVLLILLGANAAAAGGYFAVLDPMRSDAQMQLDRLTGQISDLQGKISSLKQELASFRENLPKYNKLKDEGFFSTQDRFAISHDIDTLKGMAQLQTVPFSVGDIQEVPNKGMADVKYKLLNSRIRLERVPVVFDSDIYTFLQDLGGVFPAATRIQKFYIKKDADVDKQHLQALAAGQPANFLNADITFDWMTIAPKDQPAANGAPPAGGTR